jgi:hypothetical protein
MTELVYWGLIAWWGVFAGSCVAAAIRLVLREPPRPCGGAEPIGHAVCPDCNESMRRRAIVVRR